MTSPSPAVSGLTPEERCRRVEAACFEAGYPEAEIIWQERGINWSPSPSVIEGPTAPPLAEWWRIVVICGEDPGACWACFEAASPSDWSPMDNCTHDPLTSPWPPLPSRPTIAGPTEEP